ncbi:hypothetical protein ACFX1X_026710 [Malus domestica]
MLNNMFIVLYSDLGHWNTSEGEASKEDEEHRSRTTAEGPTIEPQRHQPKLFFPTWKIIFIASSAFSLFVDPLICYIPVIDEKETCYFWNLKLAWIYIALRSFGDLFYYMDMVVFFKRFRTELSAKSFAGASPTKTIEDHHLSTLRNFIHKKPVGFLAILLRIWVAFPLLQAILIIGIYTYLDYFALIYLLPFQYTMRAYNYYEWLYRLANVETGSRKVLKAMLDLLPFIIASHLYGSMWYFFALSREIACWDDYVSHHVHFGVSHHVHGNSFYCNYSERAKDMYSLRVNDDIRMGANLSCAVELPKNMTSLPFDYGIYLYALQSNMKTSEDLPRKILQCFWWGLRNLSSFGSNLQTSFYAPEIFFSVVISISGLALFLVYLNSRVQGFQKIAEQRILRQKMKTTNQVLIRKIHIMRRFRMNSLKKVPFLGSIDEQVLKAISEHLKPVTYAEDAYIIREGEPLRKMLFIRRGTVLTYTTSKGATSVCKCLEKNDFYGEELVIWAFKFASFSELPISTATLVSQSKVEAFSIAANHLKSVVAELWLHFRKELPHSQVEYFAASSIQAAWRRYAKKAKRSEK